MDFFDILEKRTTNFTWSDAPVDKAEIISIINRVVSSIPSKQNKQPYRIDIIDDSDPELRLKLFRAVHRDDDLSEETDQGNPQTLAPILLLFSPRDPNDDKIKSSRDRVTGLPLLKESLVEIGIASASIVYAVEEAGYSTGYCGCFAGPSERTDNLHGIDYVQDLFDLDHGPLIALGIGLKGTKQTYFDPRVNMEKPLPTHGAYNIKPNISKVIHIHAAQ